MEQENSVVEENEDRFPEEVSEIVDGLLWLGYLDDTIEFCGHEFVIRTLRLEEEMLAGLLAKEYAGTISEAKAFITAQISLALVSVDGDENFCPPIGPNTKDHARARFNYVAKNWYDPTIAFLYTKYAALVERQADAIREMDFLSRENLDFFTDSQDSLIAKDDSPMAEEIVDLLDQED